MSLVVGHGIDLGNGVGSGEGGGEKRLMEVLFFCSFLEIGMLSLSLEAIGDRQGD